MTTITKFFTDLGHELSTQDNMATGNPIFVVEKKRIIYGMSNDIDDIPYHWIDVEGDYIVAPDKVAAVLDAIYQDSDEPNETVHLDIDSLHDGRWERMYYISVWEFEQVFLTKSAAKQYMVEFAHRCNTEFRIYCYSGNDSEQIKEIRKYCMELAKNEVLEANAGG